MPPSGNLAPQLDAIPLPPSSQVAVETAQNTMNQGASMPQEYWGGKTGAIAFEADKLLRGWMAGRYLGEQKQREKAVQTIGTMKEAVDQAGAAYRTAVESGDAGKIDAAGKVLQQQWDEYNTAREHYVIPPDMGKGKDGKKTFGQKVKGAAKEMFTPQHPQFYAQAALDISKKTDPRALYQPSKTDQLQQKQLEMQTAAMDKEQKNQDRWEKIALQPDDKLSKEDQQFKQWYEYTKFGRSKSDVIKDQILEKITSNGQLTDQERQLAEAYGFLKPKVASTQIRTIQDGKTGKPISQIVAIGSDGKLIGTQDLPGKEWVPPNQADLAGQVIQTEYGALQKIAKKTHPDWDDKTVNQWALSNVVTRYTGLPDFATRNQQMDVMSRAIQAVMKKHQHYSQATGTTYDDMGNAMLGSFVTAGDDGRYVWNGALGGKESHWFGPDTYGGKTIDQMRTEENNIRAELRTELKHENPKLSDQQIDDMMPPSIARAGGMQPPPTQGGAAQTGTGGRQIPQNLGQQDGELYEVTLGDGTKTRRFMSKEYADALQAQGVSVTKLQK